MGIFDRLFGGKKSGDAQVERPPARDVAALAGPLAAPAVHVIVDLLPARSYFGGDPRLPSGIAWPERGGRRLDFVARFSLPEMHAAHRIEWLPATGALLFFYDVEEMPWGFAPADRGGWAVLHVPDLDAPVAGAKLAKGEAPLPFTTVRFAQVMTLPSTDRDSVDALELDDDEGDAFIELRGAAFGGAPEHHLGGFPDPVQNDTMELECQLASHGVDCGSPKGYRSEQGRALAPGAANWRLLFQMDTDDGLGVMWGDVGRIYFWVEEPKARAANFADTWLVLQCH